MLVMRHCTVKDVLLPAVKKLQAAKIESASLDVRLLLQHVLHIESATHLLDEAHHLTSAQEKQFQMLIEERICRKPMAHILGKREFWSLEFSVTEDTLDPRPDSETLIEAVLEQRFSRAAPLRILDMGTGTGCLILTLLSEFPNATGVAVDISQAALSVASRNAESLGIKNRVECVKSDWNCAISGVFDIVISNPPYIASRDILKLAPEVALYEPMLALDGGADGLTCYRTIINALPTLLSKDGVAVLEMGFGQLESLQQLVNEQPLICTHVRQDLAGIARAIVIKHKEEIRAAK